MSRYLNKFFNNTDSFYAEGGHEYAGNINIKVIQKKIFETFLIQGKKHNSQSNII